MHWDGLSYRNKFGTDLLLALANDPVGEGAREGGTCKKDASLVHFVSIKNLELTCFTVLDFRLAISANDHHAILSPPTWKGNDVKNYG